jgi:SNF2 family DNA or RNA helicase
MAESLFNFIKKHPGIHVLLLTGTPLSNDPASLHTLMTYIGKYADWKLYRESYYELKHMPFLAYPAWFPKKDWRAKANITIQKHADVVAFADCVDSVPPETFEVVKTKAGKYEYAEDEDEHWTKDHQAEQYNKLAEIKQIGYGYRKVVLVCHYTAQIDELAKKLASQKPVFVLDGRTKDAHQTTKDAQAAEDCYFIVQAKMGMGWDGYMFGAMVLVSLAHRQIDYTQMLARLTSVDFDKPRIYYVMIGGTWDKRIYETLKSGENFNPHKHEST